MASLTLILVACGGSGGGGGGAAGGGGGTAATYSIGGTLTNYTGTGLVLHNGSEDLTVAQGATTFEFATKIASAGTYAVTVTTQPSSPNQTCTVTGGSGTVASANVTGIAVTCVNSYTIGGTLTNYSGTGLVLHNGSEDLTVAQSATTFQFAIPVADTGTYDVTVTTQPSSPNQTCTVTSGGSGTVSGANVTNIVVTCATISYTIGGSVSNLAGTGLVLQLNSANNKTISTSGAFTFATALPDGTDYAVTVLTQPTNLSQTCTVTNDTGTLSGGNIATVAVACVTNTFTVGGTVTRLGGSGLVLSLNSGAQSKTIAANGAYTFATALADGTGYTVTVSTQPGSPPQQCTVSNPTGTLAGANAGNVGIVCVGNVGTVTLGPSSFSFGIESVPIPVAAVSIGAVVSGTTLNCKLIDHGTGTITQASQPTYIRLPDSSIAPLVFNQLDFGLAAGGASTGEEDDLSVLFDAQTTALFFPNGGTAGSLPAGTYTFPRANLDGPCASFGAAEFDVTGRYYFYKTTVANSQKMNLNVWVVNSVGGLTTVGQAQADPEILGAVDVLQNVYANNVNTALDVTINVLMVSSSAYATIDDDPEAQTLFSSFPAVATNDAMNIFVVNNLANKSPGVLGYTARINGPFNRQGTIQSGTIAEYQGDDDGTILGFILAHEFGHYLGLYHTSQTNSAQDGIIGHDPLSDTAACATSDMTPLGVNGCPDRTNLMFPIVDNNPDPPITPQQGMVIRLNPAVHE